MANPTVSECPRNAPRLRRDRANLAARYRDMVREVAVDAGRLERGLHTRNRAHAFSDLSEARARLVVAEEQAEEACRAQCQHGRSLAVAVIRARFMELQGAVHGVLRLHDEVGAEAFAAGYPAFLPSFDEVSNHLEMWEEQMSAAASAADVGEG